MFLVILDTQFGLMHGKLVQKLKREQVNNLFSIVSKKKNPAIFQFSNQLHPKDGISEIESIKPF